MVFIELLRQYETEVKEAVEELFITAFTNQPNDTELLTVIIHGYKETRHPEFYKKNKLSPYVFGRDHVGFSLETFYEFFHWYRNGYDSKKKHQKRLNDPQTKDAVEMQERLIFNVEFMIYLKFWESDLLLRQLYNLTNLATGKYYDWEVRLSFSRRTFIRQQIQGPLKDLCPKAFKLIEDTYSAQIRNAIAHSKYYFMGRNLHLGNKEENEFYRLVTLSFDEWEIIFHKTLLFYNFIIGKLQDYDKYYQAEVVDKHFGLAISTPKLGPVGNRINQWVKYDEKFHRWLWSTQMDR